MDKVEDSTPYKLDVDSVSWTIDSNLLSSLKMSGPITLFPHNDFELRPSYSDILKENAELKALVAKYKEMFDE